MERWALLKIEMEGLKHLVFLPVKNSDGVKQDLKTGKLHLHMTEKLSHVAAYSSSNHHSGAFWQPGLRWTSFVVTLKAI